jgi:hypothetical protein
MPELVPIRYAGSDAAISRMPADGSVRGEGEASSHASAVRRPERASQGAERRRWLIPNCGSSAQKYAHHNRSLDHFIGSV